MTVVRHTCYRPFAMARRLYVAAVLTAIVVGVWLRLPALEIGFVSDDYAQLAMLHGVYPVERSPFDLFNFSDGSVEEATALINDGFYPWWSYQKLQLSMFRPLSSILFTLDHSLFGFDPFGYHVHSMVWWVLLVAAVALFLGELLPLSVAGTAVLLFALEEGHTFPVDWIANRSAMITGTLAFLGLWAHVRWRRRGWRTGRVLSWLLFFATMAAGEWGLSWLCYVVAYELAAERGPLAQRARALLAVVVPAVVYLVAHRLLGHGVAGSGIYLDPFTAPLTYIVAMFERIPVLVGDLVFGVSATWWSTGTPWKGFVISLGLFSPEVWKMLPGWHFWEVAMGVVGALLALALARWARASLETGVRWELRWMLLGSLLALVPMVGSFPSTRLVTPASVGLSVLLATILRHAVETLQTRRKGRRLQAVLAVIVILGITFVHVLKAGFRSWGETRGDWFAFTSARKWVLDADIDDAKIEGQRIVILSARDHTTSLYVRYLRFVHGHPLPISCWLLSAAQHAHDVTRVADNAIDVQVLGGPMLQNAFEFLFRRPDMKVKLGDEFVRDGMNVKVVRMLGEYPLTVRFTFAKSIDDPSYLWLQPIGGGLKHFEIPAVGETVRVPKPPVPNLFVIKEFEEREREEEEEEEGDGESASGEE